MGVGHNRVYKEVVLSSIVSSGFPSELGVQIKVVVMKASQVTLLRQGTKARGTRLKADRVKFEGS